MASSVKDRAISAEALISTLKDVAMAQELIGRKFTIVKGAERIEELLSLRDKDQSVILEQREKIAKLKKDIHNMRISRDKYKRLSK